MDLRQRGLATLLSRGSGKWLLLGGSTGVLCGVLGWGFRAAVDGVSHLVLGLLSRPGAGDDSVLWLVLSPLLLVAVLSAGGLVAGWLAHRFAGEAAGGGTGVAVTAYHQQQGRIRLAVPLTKLAASTATLGTGGSAGREGPISLIGAGFAAWFSDRLGLGDRDRRILLASGIAGGVSALFRAPLASALYAAEVLYSDAELEAEALIPAFISSIIAFCTYGLLDNALVGGVAGGSLFHPPPGLSFSVERWPELAGYLVLTLIIGLGARFFIRFSHAVRGRFDRLGVRPWLRPGVGAAITGVVGLAAVGLAVGTRLVPDAGHDALGVLGSGYDAIDRALAAPGEAPRLVLMALFLLIALGKMVATACTVGSGGSGGEFAPCIVIGGCLGAAVGFGLAGLPIAPHPAACTIMGMAGFLAATHRTPVAALLMVSEIAGNYQLLIPAMWVTAFSFLIAGKVSLIGGQVAGPVASPAHRGHFFQDVLAGVRVADVLTPLAGVTTLQPGSRLAECRHALRDSHQTVFPVVDDGRLIGVVTLDDLRPVLYDDAADAVTVAQDVMAAESWTVVPGDSLASAMRRFNTCSWDELPVVDVEGHLLGLLGRRRCLEVYGGMVDQMRARRTAEGYDTEAQDSRLG